MEKFFEISKWTKKMSKMGKPKYFLLTNFFCDDVEKLSSQINVIVFFVIVKFLLFF
jgi:hypothetical protein